MSAILQKQPGESYIYTVVFEKNMDVSETITAINSITATPTGLTVASPDSPIIAGKEIQFRISGGSDKQSYTVSASVSTSKSNTLVHSFILQVRNII